MRNNSLSDLTIVTKSIEINASPDVVWLYLTDANYLEKWMSDGDIEILTDWQIGSPVKVYGNMNGKHEFKGFVLENQRGKILRYSSWSWISKLKDNPENYAEIEFSLTPIKENITELTLTNSNLVAEAAYEHSNFYWSSALFCLKNLIESPIQILTTKNPLRLY